MQSVSSTYQQKPSSNLAPRVFAVLALVAAGIVVAVVVANGVGGSGSSTTAPSSVSQAASGPKDPYYVVKAGDSFVSIAKTEGVSEATIRRLNPNLDPQTLQPQNCVDLIPHGCRKLAAQSGG
jgi:LysM repeat protein